jgi:hypothetical protein
MLPGQFPSVSRFSSIRRWRLTGFNVRYVASSSIFFSSATLAEASNLPGARVGNPEPRTYGK